MVFMWQGICLFDENDCSITIQLTFVNKTTRTKNLKGFSFEK